MFCSISPSTTSINLIISILVTASARMWFTASITCIILPSLPPTSGVTFAFYANTCRHHGAWVRETLLPRIIHFHQTQRARMFLLVAWPWFQVPFRRSLVSNTDQCPLSHYRVWVGQFPCFRKPHDAAVPYSPFPPTPLILHAKYFT